jgi:hypothetical protein
VGRLTRSCVDKIVRYVVFRQRRFASGCRTILACLVRVLGSRSAYECPSLCTFFTCKEDYLNRNPLLLAKLCTSSHKAKSARRVGTRTSQTLYAPITAHTCKED